MAEFWLGLACGAPCPSLAPPNPGLATSLLACAGGAWLGLAWPRLASFLVSLSAWHGLAWLVLVWPRLALPGLAWPSLAQPGSAWPSAPPSSRGLRLEPATLPATLQLLKENLKKSILFR